MSFQDFDAPLNKKPTTPPPKFNPPYCPILRDLDFSFLQQCLNHIIHVWTINGNSFWMYPVDVKGNNLFGYAWDGTDWKYIRLPVGLIDSFS